jgi:hypothetical protein
MQFDSIDHQQILQYNDEAAIEACQEYLPSITDTRALGITDVSIIPCCDQFVQQHIVMRKSTPDAGVSSDLEHHDRILASLQAPSQISKTDFIANKRKISISAVEGVEDKSLSVQPEHHDKCKTSLNPSSMDSYPPLVRDFLPTSELVAYSSSRHSCFFEGGSQSGLHNSHL